jgi:hypothetical protein
MRPAYARQLAPTPTSLAAFAQWQATACHSLAWRSALGQRPVRAHALPDPVGVWSRQGDHRIERHNEPVLAASVDRLLAVPVPGVIGEDDGAERVLL